MITKICATRCCAQKCRGVQCLWRCFRVLGRVSCRVSSSGACHSCCLIAHFGEKNFPLYELHISYMYVLYNTTVATSQEDVGCLLSLLSDVSGCFFHLREVYHKVKEADHTTTH